MPTFLTEPPEFRTSLPERDTFLQQELELQRAALVEVPAKLAVIVEVPTFSALRSLRVCSRPVWQVLLSHRKRMN